MSLKKIFVNRSAVENNQQTDSTTETVFIVVSDGDRKHSNSIIILGPSEVKYDPNAPEGSRIWIETFNKVVLKYENDIEPNFPILETM
jgi:hypothetical protein